MTLQDKLYKILIKGDSWKTILGGKPSKVYLFFLIITFIFYHKLVQITCHINL